MIKIKISLENYTLNYVDLKGKNNFDYIKGLINLRGNIKSLVDINLLLNVNSDNEQQNIIILTVEDEEIGITVDEVEEVLDIEESSIQKMDNEQSNSYIKGILNYDNKLLTIIDIDKLLN